MGMPDELYVNTATFRARIKSSAKPGDVKYVRSSILENQKVEKKRKHPGTGESELIDSIEIGRNELVDFDWILQKIEELKINTMETGAIKLVIENYPPDQALLKIIDFIDGKLIVVESVIKLLQSYDKVKINVTKKKG